MDAARAALFFFFFFNSPFRMYLWEKNKQTKKKNNPKPKPCWDILSPLVAQRDVVWAARERALFTSDELGEGLNSGMRHQRADKDKHGRKHGKSLLGTARGLYPLKQGFVSCLGKNRAEE